MALELEHPEVNRLANELAAATGETMTEAVLNALRERLAREQHRHHASQLRAQLQAIRARCAALPVLDSRAAEQILGYDDSGLPS